MREDNRILLIILITILFLALASELSAEGPEPEPVPTYQVFLPLVTNPGEKWYTHCMGCWGEPAPPPSPSQSR